MTFQSPTQVPSLLPRDENVWLLVADSAHAEPGGKFSLLGFYGSERLQLAASTLPAPLNVSFIFLLREGYGAFRTSFSIKDPSGATIFATDMPDSIKASARENHGVVVTMQPLVVAAFGDYRLVLKLDDRRYRRTLFIGPDIVLN